MRHNFGQKLQDKQMTSRQELWMLTHWNRKAREEDRIRNVEICLRLFHKSIISNFIFRLLFLQLLHRMRKQRTGQGPRIHQ
jgi:hypothetical protein